MVTECNILFRAFSAWGLSFPIPGALPQAFAFRALGASGQFTLHSSLFTLHLSPFTFHFPRQSRS